MADGYVSLGVESLADEVEKAVMTTIRFNHRASLDLLKKAGQKARLYLSKKSPSRHDDGYISGWHTKTARDDDGYAEIVVYQKKKPGLTHLLEFGHEMFIAGVDQGRRVPAHPHIADAFAEGAEVLLKARVDNP